MRTRGVAAVLTAVGAMTGGSVLVAAPASAAAYNGACGAGYGVVNEADIGSLGTVYLTYNASSAMNCVVTVRDDPGVRLAMFAGIARADDPAWYAVDQGDYTTYAGPVYRYAPGTCVTWGGAISGEYAGDENTNCG
ncbi:spore-associated protein A [Saccharomonospora halophila]|uniref:spore-associated protein A n=1 Tax=Saccharomonospora halophila TaxID=129922 RepID=UPI00039CAF60|nr:spore-associated protein A [Saccharomonospora halophila]